MIITCVATVIAYFVCGIPFGMLVAAKMAGIDVRKEGSGNIGMTNVARTAGGKAAGITFALDVGKGTICVLLARLALISLGGLSAQDINPGGAFDWMPAWVFLGCVFGHIFDYLCYVMAEHLPYRFCCFHQFHILTFGLYTDQSSAWFPVSPCLFRETEMIVFYFDLQYAGIRNASLHPYPERSICHVHAGTAAQSRHC